MGSAYKSAFDWLIVGTSGTVAFWVRGHALRVQTRVLQFDSSRGFVSMDPLTTKLATAITTTTTTATMLERTIGVRYGHSELISDLHYDNIILHLIG